MPSKKLKIRAHGMFGATHSWSHCVRSLMYEFFKMDHDCYITSTDGYTFAKKEMSGCFERDTDAADIDLCYTLPKNFKQWFSRTSKLKVALFNWESTVMPQEWASYISNADIICPSSTAVRDVFISSGWQENKLMILPLGVDWAHFGGSDSIDIPGLKSFRFLNISIPHHRKNIDLLLDAYYTAFNSSDDVSLILKSSFDKPKNKFECDLSEIIRSAQTKHSGKVLPKVHVVIDRLPDMAPIYKAANCVVSTSSFEGFGLPMLEGLASGCQIIAPRISGQLDFLDDSNSFLVETDKIKAGEKYQYWRPDNNSMTYLPRKDDIVDSMRKVFDGDRKTTEDNKALRSKFSWISSANKILERYDTIFS